MKKFFAVPNVVKDWFSFKHTENYDKKQYMPVTVKTPYTVDRTSNGVCLPYNQDAKTDESYHSGYFTSEDPRCLWRFPVECYPSRLYIKSYITAENGRSGSFEIFIRDRKTYQGELIFSFYKGFNLVSDSKTKQYGGGFYTYIKYDSYYNYRAKQYLTALGDYEGLRTFNLKFDPYPFWDKSSEILVRFPNKTLTISGNKYSYVRFYLQELFMEF